MVTASGGQPPNGNLDRRVAVIEAVLPTLATKTDLAELGAELRAAMLSGNEKLRAEMLSGNEKLRVEMLSGNEKLRVEMLSGNEKLRVEMRSENEKLRVEMLSVTEKLSVGMLSGHEKLIAAMRAENENLREQLLLRIALVHEQMRTEVQKMHNSMFRWMVTTMLAMVIAFSGFFIGLANVLLAHVPPRDAASAGPGQSALVLPRQGPPLNP